MQHDAESQRGSGALLMVIMILLMGTLLLNATRRQLADAMSLVGSERTYLKQFTAAFSALAWGQRLHWNDDKGWQCQQQAEYHWRACLQAERLLLRADSGPHTLAVYRWGRGREGGRFQPAAHGWIDYCPLAGGDSCEVD